MLSRYIFSLWMTMVPIIYYQLIIKLMSFSTKLYIASADIVLNRFYETVSFVFENMSELNEHYIN